MTTPHHLKWQQTHPIAMFSPSVWHSCNYSLSFYPDHGTWQASFEGTTLHEGTLQECLLACQENEYEAPGMSYGEAKRSIHVRSAMYRRRKPSVRYYKNHTTPFDERIPAEDQTANDWLEYDPREDPDNAAYNETPA